MAVTTEKTKLIKFYGTTRASEAFLQAHYIYYHRQIGDHCLFAEQCPGQEPQVYLLEYTEGVRRLPGELLKSEFGLNDSSAASLTKIKLRSYFHNKPEFGESVFNLGYSETTLLAFPHQAHAAALQAGATNATGRWLMRFVEDAFGGLCMDYQVEFTEEGVMLSASNEKEFPDTPKRQLRKLQKLNLVEYHPVRGLAAVVLKFNRHHVKPFNETTLPNFMQVAFY